MYAIGVCVFIIFLWYLLIANIIKTQNDNMFSFKLQKKLKIENINWKIIWKLNIILWFVLVLHTLFRKILIQHFYTL
jgi:hypothetical protein